jgi:D-alanyl-D-alanine carboxypeptidase/D-alanyl-D-alanine-endopeptidase (penicillin-binding protein 4)
LWVAALIALALTACSRQPPARISPSVAPPGQSETSLARLARDLDAIFTADPFQNSIWGVLVQSTTRGDTLYARNAGTLVMPASSLKTVTLAAAAERLGWDFTYETRLVSVGAVADGVLDGDLVVIGTGDPSVNDRDGSAARLFSEWSDQLKAMGIRKVTGRIVGDDNAFEDDSLGFGWSWDDLAEGFATGVSGLQYNDNRADLVVEAGPTLGAVARARVEPAASGMDVRSLVATGPVDSAAALSIRRGAGSSILDVHGSVPLSASAIRRSVAVANPTLYFVSALRAALVGSGIEIGGPPVDIDEIDAAPASAAGTVVALHRSPPLSELAIAMMKESQNLQAETFMKSVATSRPLGSAAGLSVVRSVVESWGVRPAALVMRDGSGLSRYNFVTAESIVTILRHVAEDARHREPFEATLALAGVDGTLSRRMRGTAAERNVRAKTGSFMNARSVSGYLTDADGEPLVFSIIANNFSTSTAVVDQATDAALVRLVELKR